MRRSSQCRPAPPPDEPAEAKVERPLDHTAQSLRKGTGKLRHRGRAEPWLSGPLLPLLGSHPCLPPCSPTDRGPGDTAGQGLPGRGPQPTDGPRAPPLPWAWPLLPPASLGAQGRGWEQLGLCSPHTACNLTLFFLIEKDGGKIGLKPKYFLVNLYNKRIQSISFSSACFPRPRGRVQWRRLPPQLGGIANEIRGRRGPRCSLARAVFTIPGSSPLSRSKTWKIRAAQPSERWCARGGFPLGTWRLRGLPVCALPALATPSALAGTASAAL